jgi:hypothetical protein
MSSSRDGPPPDALYAGVHVIAEFINPKAHDIPSKLDEAHISELVTAQKFAIPIAVITLAIHFDVESASGPDESEVEGVFFHVVLRNRARAFGVETCIETPFPIRYEFRSRDRWIRRACVEIG